MFVKSDTLKRIANTDSLKAYLKLKQWKFKGREKNLEIWMKDENQGIILPHFDYADYETRLHEVIQVIAIAENTDQYSVLKQLEKIQVR